MGRYSQSGSMDVWASGPPGLRAVKDGVWVGYSQSDSMGVWASGPPGK